jgi:hypothetical protein
LTVLPSGTYKASASVPVSNIAFGMLSRCPALRRQKERFGAANRTSEIVPSWRAVLAKCER